MQDKRQWFIDKRIIYKQEPTITNDDYQYFPDGIETYSLFSYEYKITSHSNLLRHYSIIRYLNPDIDYDLFLEVCEHIADNYSDIPTDYDYVNTVFVHCDKPTPRIKRVIFNDYANLTPEDKIAISNKLTKGLGIDNQLIETTKTILIERNIKPTQKAVANLLQVSLSTIKRYNKSEKAQSV